MTDNPKPECPPMSPAECLRLAIEATTAMSLLLDHHDPESVAVRALLSKQIEMLLCPIVTIEANHG